MDVVFSMPWHVYTRFSERTGNIQSQILQEVKNVLLTSFPNTAIKGNGPVVVVPHWRYEVEVIPAFYRAATDKQYLLCGTENGGQWKNADYDAELSAVSVSNTLSSGNTRHLVKMLKQWQRNCNVPLKSFWLELLAVEFLCNWEHRGKSFTYYDWMVRDFFQFLLNCRSKTLFAPGTYEAMYIGDAWYSKAEKALKDAKLACTKESENETIAYLWWRDLFGQEYPS